MPTRIKPAMRRLVLFAVLALIALFSFEHAVYGFGWGVQLPPLPPLPGAPIDEPPAIINDPPPIEPDDPIGSIDDENPPNGPGDINDSPEPATIITGLVGATALGIASWWRRRRRNSFTLPH